MNQSDKINEEYRAQLIEECRDRIANGLKLGAIPSITIGAQTLLGLLVRPAGHDDDLKLDLWCDRARRDGLTEGFRLGRIDDVEAYNCRKDYLTREIGLAVKTLREEGR